MSEKLIKGNGFFETKQRAPVKSRLAKKRTQNESLNFYISQNLTEWRWTLTQVVSYRFRRVLYRAAFLNKLRPIKVIRPINEHIQEPKKNLNAIEYGLASYIINNIREKDYMLVFMDQSSGLCLLTKVFLAYFYFGGTRGCWTRRTTSQAIFMTVLYATKPRIRAENFQSHMISNKLRIQTPMDNHFSELLWHGF